MTTCLKALLLTTAALGLASCAAVKTEPTTGDASLDAAPAAVEAEAVEAPADPMPAAPALEIDPLAAALAADFRAEDSARDGFRRPAETLAFFGIEPSMTVAEYAPGGGWYTRVLAPYVSGEGRYLAVNHDIDAYLAGDDVDPERFANAKAFSETFPGRVNEWTGLDADTITAFEIDETPEAVAGSVDALVVFRSMHGPTSRGIEDDMAAHAFALLKPGGTLGIVQHRAKADAPDDYANGTKGYLRQADVVANFEAAGFQLVGTSEVNANAKDTADYEDGVWTLPPVLRGGETFAEIGESDRMTLKFMKPSDA
ncbi:MAG: hypothetical protein AAF253_14835 [Pseudomonadota bacterium]